MAMSRKLNLLILVLRAADSQILGSSAVEGLFPSRPFLRTSRELRTNLWCDP